METLFNAKAIILTGIVPHVGVSTGGWVVAHGGDCVSDPGRGITTSAVRQVVQLRDYGPMFLVRTLNSTYLVIVVRH